MFYIFELTLINLPNWRFLHPLVFVHVDKVHEDNGGVNVGVQGNELADSGQQVRNCVSISSNLDKRKFHKNRYNSFRLNLFDKTSHEIIKWTVNVITSNFNSKNGMSNSLRYHLEHFKIKKALDILHLLLIISICLFFRNCQDQTLFKLEKRPLGIL